MPSISDSAVVLTRLDYSETSQVIVLFTREHGKVRAIAKGVKRSTKTRFAVGIDLLDVGRVVISARHERAAGLANVVEWKQERSLSGLREKLSRLHAAQYVAEVTLQLTEDWDPHVALYDRLLAALEDLTDADEPLQITTAYQHGLLNAVGLLPLFDRCVLCSRDSDLGYFSSIEGGTICRDCAPGQVEKHEISKPTLLAARGESEPNSWIGVFSVLNYHIAHLTGRNPLLASKLVPAGQRRVVE
jgi:DNA repair protein RecO (recombination protein O)